MNKIAPATTRYSWNQKTVMPAYWAVRATDTMHALSSLHPATSLNCRLACIAGEHGSLWHCPDQPLGR